MKKPLKIAIYSGDIPSTTFIERLILGLSLKGHSIYLFGVKKQSIKYADDIKVLGYRNNRFFKGLYLLKYSCLLFLFKNKSKKKLDNFLKRESQFTLYSKVKYYPVLYHQPDIIHVQWAKGIKEWIWVQDFGMKLVLSLRGAHINYSPLADENLASIYKTCFPKVNGFHAVSQALKKETQKYGVDASKIKVVYSGLNLESFPFLDKNGRSDKLKIVSIGRSHWKKGYHYALDACAILKKKNIPFTYEIIGIDNSDIELLYQIKDLNLDSEVKLSGRLSFERVSEAIGKADVLLLPSVEEGVANVALEAMALGTLVVSTDCGGMTEVFEHNKNGFVVPVRDPLAIAEILEHLLTLPQSALQEIRNEARDTIETRFQETKMVESMVNLYAQILKIT